MFGLYNWKTRAAIWEHCNLWAQLCVYVKDIRYTNGGGSVLRSGNTPDVRLVGLG